MTATTTRAAETWAHMLRCQREGVPAFPWALDFAQDGGDDLDREKMKAEKDADKRAAQKQDRKRKRVSK